ncbi:MAG TPA: TIGR04086 family membrane protein [Candidatus Copromorpha excrementigallinarum]|uniref:TIGR04086 family membrane protein n=1 Tax=Candidatus Allocopromorpha excrementigallinarum TaxID=2840742 RepID=A0A9D1I2M8_9FIRM|nr:TIGR04086 family membrane protein [Candidatus Copromorpha excrementigallinarum]
MEIIRKTLKAYVAALTSFVLLTFALAALISYTAFKESWAFGGLIVIMSLSTALLGFMEGAATGKRGLAAGAAAALIFVAVILAAAGAAFSESFALREGSLFYLIPIGAGAAGGIAGTNMGK